MRTISRFGKLESLKTQTKQCKVGITDLNKVRWADKCEISCGDYIMFHSVLKKIQKGVAVVVMKNK